MSTTKKTKKKMFCPNVSLLALGHDGKQGVLTRVRCKSWSCEYCSYINRVQWLMRFMRGAKRLDALDWRFITVTATGQSHNSKKTLQDLQKHMDRLLKRMKRISEYDQMPYLRVFEKHKSGEYHAHLIMQWQGIRRTRTKPEHIYKTGDRAGTLNEKKWLKDTCHDCGLGYIVDIQTITPDYDPDRPNDQTDQYYLQVVSYVLKYMTKDMQSEIAQTRYKRMRQIQASQHFPPELRTDFKEKDMDVKEKDMDWEVKSSLYFDTWLLYQPMTDAQAKRLISYYDFYEGRYPDEIFVKGDDQAIS